MFSTQEFFIQAEIDYRVQRMVADREAAELRRQVRSAGRRDRRKRTRRRPAHQTANAR